MSEQRQYRHFASAEVTGRVVGKASGYTRSANPIEFTRLDIDVDGNRLQATFMGARARDADEIEVGSTVHILGRLNQWGEPRRIDIVVANNNHSWSLREGAAPRSGWSLRGIIEGTTTSAEDPSSILVQVIVVIPAAERNGRRYEERRTTYEVTAEGEIAARIAALPHGTTVDLAGIIESTSDTDGFGRRITRSALRCTRMAARGVEGVLMAGPQQARPAEPAAEQPVPVRRQRAELPF